MSIVRVTDPRNPAFIGQVPTPLPAERDNLRGDVGVYTAKRPCGGDDDDDDGRSASYAYYTTEADGVGINILELNQLDQMGPAPDPTFQITASSIFEEGGYQAAHNIYVHQETGFAYVVGFTLAGANLSEAKPWQGRYLAVMSGSIPPMRWRQKASAQSRGRETY